MTEKAPCYLSVCWHLLTDSPSRTLSDSSYMLQHTYKETMTVSNVITWNHLSFEFYRVNKINERSVIHSSICWSSKGIFVSSHYLRYHQMQNFNSSLTLHTHKGSHTPHLLLVQAFYDNGRLSQRVSWFAAQRKGNFPGILLLFHQPCQLNTIMDARACICAQCTASQSHRKMKPFDLISLIDRTPSPVCVLCCQTITFLHCMMG